MSAYFGTRVVNTFSAAMPYAQFATYALQLGYLGYHLYQLYQQYMYRYEENRSNGREETFEQTMELIVKPKRKTNPINKSRTSPDLSRSNKTNTSGGGSSSSNNFNRSENQENIEQSSNDYNGAVVEEANSDDESNFSERIRRFDRHLQWRRRWQPIASTSTSTEFNHIDNNIDDDEVQIIYDSSSDGTTKVKSEILVNPTAPEQFDEHETVSNVSTSLESTDSNKGIVHNIYTDCFICTRPLNDSSKPVATLPFCLHPFHETCLNGVLKWHPKCPVCDFHIFSPI